MAHLGDNLRLGLCGAGMAFLNTLLHSLPLSSVTTMTWSGGMGGSTKQFGRISDGDLTAFDVLNCLWEILGL